VQSAFVQPSTILCVDAMGKPMAMTAKRVVPVWSPGRWGNAEAD